MTQIKLIQNSPGSRMVLSSLITVIALIVGSASSGEETKFGMSINTGTMAARPLTSEWLNYWIKGAAPFDSSSALDLAVSLSSPDPVETDSWSTRTEAEIHTAIDTDDLLRNNAWRTFRCSKYGCIAAIQSLDAHILQRAATYEGRLLSYVTPRANPRHEADMATLESDRITVGSQPVNRFYLIFFIFPDRAVSERPVGSTQSSTQTATISPSVAADIQAANDEVQNKEWTQAIAHLHVVQGKPGLTNFDLKNIHELTGFTNIKLRDFVAAQIAYEKALAIAPEFSSSDTLKDTRQILGLAVLNRDYLKAVEVGRRLAEQYLASAEDLSLISQSYFALLDCKLAIVWAEKSAALSDKAGSVPLDSVSNIRSGCARIIEAAEITGTKDQSLVAR